MCTEHNPDRFDIHFDESARATAPNEPAPEIGDNRGFPAVENELVEIEFTLDQQHVDPSAERAIRPRKRALGAPLPKWEYVDLDRVLPAPSIEAALRAAGIIAIHRPSTGFLKPAGITRLAMITPIHVVQQDNVWHCILGWDLAREAREILTSPRLYPACIHADMSLEELKDYLIVERVGVPLRHQMSGQELNALAKSLLDVIMRNVNLFVRLGVDQWARIMGRKLRWLRYRLAISKAGADHDKQLS